MILNSALFNPDISKNSYTNFEFSKQSFILNKWIRTYTMWLCKRKRTLSKFKCNELKDIHIHALKICSDTAIFKWAMLSLHVLQRTLIYILLLNEKCPNQSILIKMEKISLKGHWNKFDVSPQFLLLFKSNNNKKE